MVLNRFLSIILILWTPGLFALGTSAASPSPPLAKTNCTDKCGNISIPFPFGIGPARCFLNYTFEVVCENNTIPKLKKFNLEVLSITLPGYYSTSGAMYNVSKYSEGELMVKHPIVYKDCTGKQAAGDPSLVGSPFYFSKSRNVFATVGCNNLAIMADTESVVVGCNSRCNGSSITNSNRYNGCTGFNCCQTSIQAGLQDYDIDFKRIDEANTGEDPCKFAFLADQEWFGQNFKDLDGLRNMDFTPLVLDWTLEESTLNTLGLMRSTDSTYYCGKYVIPSRNTSEPPLYSCYCQNGYAGNAILENCQDIDECEDYTLNNCPWMCLNTPGSYMCMNRRSTGELVAMGIGIGLAAILLSILAFCLWKIIKRKKKMKQKEKFFKRNGGLLLEQELSSSEGNFVEKTRLFSSRELEKATDNFSKNRVLGRGGQGTVYKGMLADGRIVAIKKSIAMDGGKVEQFINEVVILSQINHRNVVKLLGCCLETQVPLLVYEFIPNGTLYHYLHDPNEELPMLWPMRLRVASEVAGALYYLHSAASVPVFHRDIKSTNIMLDEKYRAKVADFGTSKSVSLDKTHVTTMVQGTFGYLDPEYFQSSQFTDKSDVYSFGVVLAELLTRQKAVSTVRPEEHRGLATYFLVTMEEDRLFDIVDPQILKQGRKEEIVAVASLARRCLNLHGRSRPTMREVAAALENINMSHNPTAAGHGHGRGDPHHEPQVHSWDDFPTASFSSLDVSETSSFDVLPLLGRN